MRPSPVLFGFSLLLLVMAVLSVLVPETRPFWWLPAPIGGALALADALTVPGLKRPRLDRKIAPLLTVGKEAEVELTFEAPVPNRRLRLFDGIPSGFRSAGLPITARPTKDQVENGLKLTYNVVSDRRGLFEFTPAWVERPSPLGFWVRRYRLGPRQEVRVFPDLHRLAGSGFHFGGSPAPSQVARNLRRRGLGLEFHQLREYRQGDMMRTVDQKATSRFHKLIVREMQEEEDQTILFFLDTGYRMTEQEDGISHFDHAFEAMLSLAYVALRQGDRVGVRTWGPDERWIPPMRSVSAFPKLVHRLYDVEARPEASSPASVLSELLPRMTRRTLIFLLTNFREEDGEGIAPLIPILRSRHLFCTVWIREAVAEALASRIPRSHDEALETAMARSFLNERRRCRVSWESQGVLTIDTTAKSLRPLLLQRYWDIKTKGLL